MDTKLFSDFERFIEREEYLLELQALIDDRLYEVNVDELTNILINEEL